MHTTPRPQLAKHTPSLGDGHPYHTYWFADVRVERAHACDCPDYFHRNIVAGDPTHLCHHLRELADRAIAVIWREVTQSHEGNVDELADALSIPRRRNHAFSAVYVDGVLDTRATVQAARDFKVRL
jgi:hypothetical protein